MADIDHWQDLKDEERQRAAARRVSNLASLRGSTLPFTLDMGGAIARVRGKGYPPVDYWLSENRWRIGTKDYFGDVTRLLYWLKMRSAR